MKNSKRLFSFALSVFSNVIYATISPLPLPPFTPTPRGGSLAAISEIDGWKVAVQDTLNAAVAVFGIVGGLSSSCSICKVMNKPKKTLLSL